MTFKFDQEFLGCADVKNNYYLFVHTNHIDPIPTP